MQRPSDLLVLPHTKLSEKTIGVSAPEYVAVMERMEKATMIKIVLKATTIEASWPMEI